MSLKFLQIINTIGKFDIRISPIPQMDVEQLADYIELTCKNEKFAVNRNGTNTLIVDPTPDYKHEDLDTNYDSVWG